MLIYIVIKRYKNQENLRNLRNNEHNYNLRLKFSPTIYKFNHMITFEWILYSVIDG